MQNPSKSEQAVAARTTGYVSGKTPGFLRCRPWTLRSLCLLAALSWAIGNVISRQAGVVAPAKRLGALSLTVWSSLVVPLPALGLSALIEGPDAIAAGVAAFGWRPILSTLYTAGLCTLVGYAIFNALLARNRSASVVPWVLLAPVVAMASAALLLGQIPNLWETVGGLVLVGGVFIANAPDRRADPQSGARSEVSGPAVTNELHNATRRDKQFQPVRPPTNSVSE